MVLSFFSNVYSAKVSFCHSEAEERRVAPCKAVESGIPLKIGIQSPSFTDKFWNPVPGIQNPQREIENPRLSWISLYGARPYRKLAGVMTLGTLRPDKGDVHENVAEKRLRNLINDVGIIPIRTVT